MTDQQPLANLPAPLQPMREQLPGLLEKFIPKMEVQRRNADEALDSITSVNTKEEADDAIETLAAVKSVYDSNQKMRMQMTSITDAFKDSMMEYERDFNPDAKAKNKYNEKKNLVVAWQQREHDRVRQEQQELAKRKAKKRRSKISRSTP